MPSSTNRRRTTSESTASLPGRRKRLRETTASPPGRRTRLRETTASPPGRPARSSATPSVRSVSSASRSVSVINLVSSNNNVAAQRPQNNTATSAQPSARPSGQEPRVTANRVRQELRTMLQNARNSPVRVVRPAELPHARANSPEVAAPSWLQVQFGTLTLKSHQIAACRLFARNIPGLLLYYKVGSGKTLAAVAAAENLARRENRRRRVVVIVPASLKGNFEQQMRAALASNRDALQYYDIMSFHGVHGLTQEQRVAKARDAVLIIDEAQNLRNPLNKRGKKTMLDSVMDMAAVAHKRLLLSGTPVMNYPIDIGSLLALIDPTNAPKTLKQWTRYQLNNGSVYNVPEPTFKKRYSVAATERRDELAAMMRCTTLFYEPPAAVVAAHYPTKTEMKVEVQLTPQQTAEHLQAALKNPGPPTMTDVLRMADRADDYNPSDELAFLIGPRQINNRSRTVHTAHAKIDRAVAHISARHATDPASKFLVYSFFLGAGLTPIANLLRARGVQSQLFTGNMNQSEKNAAIRRFNEGRVRVLLISDAGKEGLDLKGTSEVHVMEPSWNEDKVQQIIGRAVRYRSHSELPREQRRVDVYRYVAMLPPNVRQNLQRQNVPTRGVLFEHSADEIMWRLSEMKQFVNRQFLQWMIAISDRNLRDCL